MIKRLRAVRFSLRHQVLLLFFILVFIPFAYIGYFSYTKTVEVIESVSSKVSLDMIDKSGKNLENYLNLVDNAQNDLMYSPEVQDLLVRDPKSSLEEIGFINDVSRLTSNLSTNLHNYTIRLFPLSPSKYYSFISTFYNGRDVEQEAWFQRAKDKGVPFWQLFLPANNPVIYPEPTISRVKRLYNLQSAQVGGIVVLDLKLSTLQDFLAPLQQLEQQQIVVIDEQNTVLYHADPAQLGKPLQSPELLSFVHSDSRRASETITIGDEPYLVAYSTLDNEGWRVISLIPLSVLTQPASGLETITIVFLAFYALLSICTLMYITARFTTPIQRLVHSMRKLERGDFSAPTGVTHRGDEIGWLYRGYQTMVTRIFQLVDNVEKSAKEKRELEFQVMTHQISPHFLYNTLESIRWKAEAREAHDISQMVSSLGNFFRLSLNDGKELTTIEGELNHVRAYVDIVSARNDIPIQVVYLVDKEVMRLPCLRLILQPLVENSIKHGSTIKDNAGIKIVISGYKQDAMLRMDIRDNGPGFSDAARETLFSDAAADTGVRKGVGLRNVHERLVLYFGPRFGLRIMEGVEEGAGIELMHPRLDPHVSHKLS